MGKRYHITKFREVFAPYFTDKGFSLKDTQFRKSIGDVEHYVSFTVSKQRGTDSIGINTGFGIRLPEIENILRPGEDNITVGMPIHLLKPERIYYDYVIENPGYMAEAFRAIIPDIEKYGFPFLDGYHSPESVFQALSSDDPDKWFMCSPDYRDTLLVAFELLRSGKEKALNIGQQMLGKYEGRMPKYSKGLRSLLARLKAMGEGERL